MIEFIDRLPLVVLIVFIVVYSVRALFIIYHLLKFGLDYKTKILALVFSMGSVLLIVFTYNLFSKIQWNEYIDISKYRNTL